MTSPRPAAETPRPLSLAAAATLVGASLALTAALAALVTLDLLPRGNAQWSWPLLTPPAPWGVAAIAALGAAVLAALLVGDRLRAAAPPSRATAAVLLVVLLALGLLTCGGVALHNPRYPAQAPLVVLSDLALGYYNLAAQLPGPAEAFSGHLARAREERVPDRIRTHPPGPVLLMMALREAALSRPQALAGLEAWLARSFGLTPELLRRAARGGTTATLSPLDALVALPVAWLLTLLPALIVLPAYGLGAALADRRVGLAAALLSLALPALLCFTPGIDGVGAVIAATAVWWWAAALRAGRWWLYLLAGLGAAAALLWSYGYLALAPVALVLAWPGARGDQRLRLSAVGLSVAVAAFVVVYGVLDAATGYSLPASLRASLHAQAAIMAREGRDYFSWLALNPYGFALFCGPGLLLLFAAGLRSGAGEPGRLGRAVLATLILLLLLGTTRAEVERIWVFLMPLLAVTAAGPLSRLPRSLALWGPALLVAAQVAWALTLMGQWALVVPY